ncbi:MAG: hypothetical protein AAF919_14765 [Pseudomonadota bacterium]
MRRRVQRRRPGARGFALAEALVSLAVAAMTLAMLTGASWGLRTVSDRTAPSLTDAGSLLTTRRVLHAWAAAVEPSGGRDPAARIVGNAAEMRMALTDSDGRPMVVALTVTRDGDLHAVSAARQLGRSDARQIAADARRTTIYRDARVLRLSYLMPGEDGIGRSWSYEIDPDRGTPFAVALEAGAERLILAPIHSNIAPDCLVALGPGAADERQCAAR